MESKRSFRDWLLVLPQIQSNTIPQMIHPLSSGWSQPHIKQIQIDNEFALMSNGTFKQLMEYSHSQPSGVYEGKMWKSHRILYGNVAPQGEKSVKGKIDHWRLHWFGFSKDPNKCSNNSREIILV